MPVQTKTSVKNDAAEAFYGQSEIDFAAQLKKFGASDPRLMKAFLKTRERFLNQGDSMPSFAP